MIVDSPPAALAPFRARPHRRPRRPTLAIVVMVGLTVAVHLILALRMRGPIIHPDEFGSLDIGRYIAHGGQRPQTEYYPGMGLLLTPVWWFTSSAATVYRAALMMNSVAAGALWLGVWALARRLAPQRSVLTAVVVATLVCLYPPFVVGSDLIWSETVFVAAFTGVALLMALLLERPSARRGIVLGLGVDGLVLLHPRGLAVAVATMAVALLCLRPYHRHAPVLLGLAGCLAAGVVGVEAIVHLVGASPPAGFATAYDASGIVSRQLSVTALRRLLLELVGELWYLSMATLGVVPVALGIAASALWRTVRGERDVATRLGAYILLSFAGVWGLAALFADNGIRGDQLVYGRYAEGALAPLLVLGLLGVLGLAQRRTWPAVASVVAGLMIAGTVVIRYGYTRAELSKIVNWANVLALYPTTRDAHLHLARSSMWALGAAVIVAALVVRWPWLAAALLALGGAFVSNNIENNYLVSGSRDRMAQTVVTDALVAIDRAGLGQTCVAWDAAVPSDLRFFYWADRYRLPLQRFDTFDASTQGAPCGALAISDKTDFAQRYPGSRLVVDGGGLHQNLWVLPAPLQQQLVTAGATRH